MSNKGGSQKRTGNGCCSRHSLDCYTTEAFCCVECPERNHVDEEGFCGNSGWHRPHRWYPPFSNRQPDPTLGYDCMGVGATVIDIAVFHIRP